MLPFLCGAYVFTRAPRHALTLRQESLKLAIRYLPDEPSAPHTLGQLYTTVLRNPVEALACANEALRRDDRFAPALLLKANSLIRREEWAAAIVELNKFYDKFPAFFKAQKFAPPAAQVLSETVRAPFGRDTLTIALPTHRTRAYTCAH